MSGKREVEDYIEKHIADEFMDISKRLKFNPAKRYFVMRAIFKVSAGMIGATLAMLILTKTIAHYRQILLVKALGTFATSQPAAVSSGIWLIAAWALLGIGDVISNYNSSKTETIANHIQLLVSAKGLELYLAKDCSSRYSNGINTLTRSTSYELAASFQTAINLIADSFSQLFNVYIVVSKMGLKSLIPIAVALANTTVACLVKRMANKYKSDLEIKKQPKINTSLNNFLTKMRAIKFYLWEHLFLKNDTFELNSEDLPFALRMTTGIVDIVSSAVPEIAAAFMLLSFIHSNEQIAYLDVAILLSSVNSLISFTRRFAAVPSILKQINSTEQAFEELFEVHKTPYIEHQPICNSQANVVTMDSCKFSWGNGKFELEPPNLAIRSGEFVAVIGPVGKGKSSLLSAICGEMPIANGKGCVYGRIGYVSQSPWIMNTSFRENILFGNSYDKAKYNQVIAACALTEDIRDLPAGDATEIGFKGVNLSGGQKARLALARAIYTDADIFILDDILSAVDVEVGRHIIEHVLTGNGLISSKTRMLVTHAEYVVPLSDKLIVFSENNIVVSDQASINYQSLFKHKVTEAPKNLDDKDNSSKATHTLMPETNVFYPNSVLLHKFIQFSGYTVVALSALVQFFNAYLLYYLERKRINLLASVNSQFIEVALLKQYLLYNAVIAMTRTFVGLFDSWMQYNVWSKAAKNNMYRTLIKSLLFTKLSTFERLSRHVIQSIFEGELIYIALILPMNLVKMIQTIFTAGYALLNMVETLAPLLLIIAPLACLTKILRSKIEKIATFAQMEVWRKSRWDMVNVGGELIAGHRIIRVHDKVPIFVERFLQIFGVVGRTGAGKSSLSQALMRLVEPDSGSIEIDGVDISTIGLHALRSQISIVPQDPVLFEGTVRENLDPDNKYSDDEIWQVLRKAQIDQIMNKATGVYTPAANTDSIADNEGPWVAGIGLNKWVENDGRNFSLGQRQLLCLCRALLWRRSILILDEATANVDSETDELMQEIIRKEFADCTVITIAHRLNTIMDSDRVLVMDQGQVVEFDKPDVLLNQKNSRFSQLVRNTKFN
ncbi:hypothetical protein IWW36_001914 [Coemansia brasiliensis]|uniref:ABC transporter domain-containing protein n=1 Tax=Coemansia brasiliensis TaxID=2650707 RepID=A0A9W8I895_9FUNG|nr:hypothetical protein IWW36_001914 [Coemansia brasiliensis]